MCLKECRMCEYKISGVRESECILARIMGAPGLINVTRCSNDSDEEEILIITYDQ